MLVKLKQIWPLSFIVFVLLTITIGFQGCGKSDSAPSSSASSENPTNSGNNTTNPSTDTKIKFTRIKNSQNGQSFKVSVSHNSISTSFVSSASISRGSLSAWSQKDESTIEATVTPDSANPTGRYELTISTSDGKTFKRTPIVLAYINDRWNQPELFMGSVNTNGWEDSPMTIVTKDASGNESLYLAMVYMPIRFACAHSEPKGSVNNPNCQKIHGPYTAPKRPNMTIASYVASDGTIDQHLTKLMGPSVIGAAKMGATNYVFKIQDDGYNGYLGTPSDSPQALYYADDDGYSTNAGPFIFKNGSNYSLMYHFDKLIDSQIDNGAGGKVPLCPKFPTESGIDTYILNNYDFNAPSIELGHYVRVDPGQKFSDGTTNSGPYPCPELLLNNHAQHGITTVGSQDNSTVYFPANGQPVVFFDNEGVKDSNGNLLGYLGMQVLSAGGSFPVGPWTTVTGLPIIAAPSTPNTEKSQPVLTDKEFCVRNELDVECTPYNGGNPMQAASYGTTVKQLGGLGWATSNIGQISAVGEPSLFTYKNQNCMSFAIAEYADSTGNQDIGVAWICE